MYEKRYIYIFVCAFILVCVVQEIRVRVRVRKGGASARHAYFGLVCFPPELKSTGLNAQAQQRSLQGLHSASFLEKKKNNIFFGRGEERG